MHYVIFQIPLSRSVYPQQYALTKRPLILLATVCTAYFNGSKDSSNRHGVGLAVGGFFIGQEKVLVGNISERIQRAGKDIRVTLGATSVCWTGLDNVAAVQAPPGDQIFIVMDANARTGERGGADSKVMAAYGCDVRNDNITPLSPRVDKRKIVSCKDLLRHAQRRSTPQVLRNNNPRRRDIASITYLCFA